MKRLFLPLVLGCVMLGCSSRVQVETQVPDIPDSLGVSAPFAGFIGQTLLVGGGCNFPDLPAAEGGQKKYYDAIYACHVEGDSLAWHKVATLPVPLAYGSAIELPEGLLLLGGRSAESSHEDVRLLRKNGDLFNLTSLPSLPVSIDNAAVTTYNHTVYITGGNHGDGGQALYALRPGCSAWVSLPPYPGGRRIQPVLLASGNYLYLAGGFDNTGGRSDVFTDMLVYSIDKAKWTDRIPLPAMSDGSPRACVGASGTVVKSDLVITGGVNYQIFKEAISGNAPEDYLRFPPEWYKFNDDILVYDVSRKEWKVKPAVKGMAKAGGVLLHRDNQLFMICGELKPGIRTPKIAVRRF